MNSLCRRTGLGMRFAILTVAGCSVTSIAADVPTRVLNAAADTGVPDSGYTIRGIAAGGPNWVAAMLERPSKLTPIWYSDNQGTTSSLLDATATKRTANYVPGRLESRLGISNAGKLCFSADLSPTPLGTLSSYHRFVDSLWTGTAALARPNEIESQAFDQYDAEGEPFTKYWRFLSRPGMTTNSKPFYLAGEADISDGPSTNRAVYLGVGASAMRELGGGDTVSPDGAIIGTNASIDSFSMSPLASSIVAVVKVDRGYADVGEWRVIRRSISSIGPGPAITVLSQSATWNYIPVRRFYLPLSGEYIGCGIPGSWYAAIDTMDRAEQDSVLVKDGVKLHQEGEIFDGLTLAGPPLVVVTNPTNDLLIVWGAIQPGPDSTINTAAFLNDHKILAVGDQVDTNGDGIVESTSLITYIAPLGALGGHATDGKVSAYLSVQINGSPALVRVRGVSHPATGNADFNGDGDVGTDADIISFFECMSGVCCPTCGSADFDGDGDLGTDRDIDAFFRALAGGNC